MAPVSARRLSLNHFSHEACGRLAAAGVLALAALLLFARLGARSLWHSEFLWAEIAREMQLTHDYFWPAIIGRVYYDKPLVSYWLILAASWVTGMLNEAACRIPSALSGLMAVGLLILLVRRLYDWSTAALSGFILATSFSFVFFSRDASADVETIAGELGALLLFIHHEERQDGWWAVGLWLIMAATSLIKGLLGFVLPIMIIGLFCVLAEGWRELGEWLLHGPVGGRIRWLIARNRWLFNRKSLVAIPLGLAFYCWPFVVSRELAGSNQGFYMAWRENVVRFFHPFDHRNPVYLYSGAIFALMAPWSMLLPAALVQAHWDRRFGLEPRRPDRFILIFFWATFVFFTVSGSRRGYYLLPILPPAAVLVARLLLRRGQLFGAAKRLLDFGFWTIAAAALGGVVFLIQPHVPLPLPWNVYLPMSERALLALFLASMIAVLAYARTSFGRERIVTALCVIAYLSMFFIHVFLIPATNPYHDEQPFARRVIVRLGASDRYLGLFQPFGVLGPLFYMAPSHPLPTFYQASQLDAAIADGRIRWVMVREKDIPAMTNGGKIVDAQRSFPFEDPRERRHRVVLMCVDRRRPGVPGPLRPANAR
jgi:4-amino-4-deoxy-L-arabinose transferase-like glycosyltransferase